MRAARTPALSGPAWRTSTAYSSPPIRATRSESRNARRSSAAVSRSARSPTAWPAVSFTRFNSSRSANTTSSVSSPRRATRRSRVASVRKPRRVYKPLSSSTSAQSSSAAREASVRLVRRRRGDREAIGRRAVQEVPHPQRCLVAVAHHQHREVGVVLDLRLAPAGGLASIDRLAPLGLIASFLLERDELQAALAGATLQVGAAGGWRTPPRPT